MTEPFEDVPTGFAQAGLALTMGFAQAGLTLTTGLTLNVKELPRSAVEPQ